MPAARRHAGPGETATRDAPYACRTRPPERDCSKTVTPCQAAAVQRTQLRSGTSPTNWSKRRPAEGRKCRRTLQQGSWSVRSYRGPEWRLALRTKGVRQGQVGAGWNLRTLGVEASFLVEAGQGADERLQYGRRCRAGLRVCALVLLQHVAEHPDLVLERVE